MSARFHAIWLRDNAQDEATRDAGNGQRLIALSEIPSGIRVTGAKSHGDVLNVTFSNGHVTRFPEDWLRTHAYDRAHVATPWSDAITLWRGDHTIRCAGLGDLQSNPDALRQWLAAVRRDGVAKVHGLPTTSGSLEKVVNLFGYIRETNYGRWFEVRSEINPTNLAYTNLGLQAHTDNPYRDPVPGLQILACLENTVEGGESGVVDGFAAAETLRQENPDGFEALARYPARFEYAGSSGVRLTSKRPVIERNPDGEVIAIRFNNRSMAAVTDIPFDDMGVWYAALRRLGEIIDAPDSQITFRLDPGEAFIVDNTRVLHARNAFSSGGMRWLQGCYADKDGLLSTLSTLEAS
ncbi:TauD/TfdA family dioxygenase [Marivita sp. S6314]|nr:TauD/TfdA family dioxygenase [Marivita sp. S6314]